MQEWIKAFITPANLDVIFIYFLLVIPIILTVGTIARHMIGLKMMSLNVLVALVFVLSFIVSENSVVSIITGFAISVIIYFLSFLYKKIIANVELHHFARLSFVLSLVAVTVMLIFVLIVQYAPLKEYIKISSFNAFAFVFAVMLGEQFLSSQIQKGIKTSRQLFFNTLFLSTLIAFLVSWSEFQGFILEYPYIVFIFVLLSFLVGRYQGMRMSEVFRFNNVSSGSNNLEKND